MKIVFWSAGDNGSSWYRCDEPARMLQWRGHDVTVTQTLTARQMATADVIVGSRVAAEGPSEVWQNLARTGKQPRPRLVLDVDDAYFSIGPTNPAAAGWPPEQLDRLAANMAVADVVTCASEGIAEDVRRGMSERTLIRPVSQPVVVPNALDAGILGWPRDYAGTVPGRITVGWAGTASTAPGFEVVARAIGLLLLQRPEVDVRLVGMPERHPALRKLVQAVGRTPIEHSRLQSMEWVHHGIPYLQTVAGFDIWVAPYLPGDDFTEAKFPTKALEAGMLGIPLVASTIRPYREWITPGTDGLLVSDLLPHLWLVYLRQLVDSAELRQRIGEASRSRATSNICQAVADRWGEVVQG